MIRWWRAKGSAEHPGGNPNVGLAGADQPAIGGRKIKVLFIIPTLDVGGAEMDLVHNAPRLDPTRFEVVVCCMLRRGVLEARLIDAGNCTIVGPFAAVTKPPRELVRRFGGLQSLLRSLWPSVRRRIASIGRWVPRAIRPPLSWYRTLGRAVWILGRVARILGRVAQTLGRAVRSLTEARRRFQRSLHGLLPAHWLVFLRLAVPMVRYIDEAGIDIVHTILPNAYVVGGLACLMTRRPLVMSRVSLNWYQAQQPVYRLLERHIMHRFVRIAIGNCRGIMRELEGEGIRERRRRLIYNGIPITAFEARMASRASTRAALAIPADAFVLCTVANLWPYKGHADLLTALSLTRLPDGWVALIVGRDIDGQRDRLEAMSVQLGLRDNVRFLGERNDVPALLGATDLYTVASHTEGVPNNVLEAMCAGLAVVSTDVGGLPELVVHGETGWLVPVRQPDAMAGAIAELAADAPRRRAMGEAGRQRVAGNFSIEISVAKLEAIYGSIGPRRL